MKLLTIPEGASLQEQFKFLKDNKIALIKQKKMFIKKTDSCMAPTEMYTVTKEGTLKAVSSLSQAEEEDALATILARGTVRVTVVANTALWMDSQKDVILPGAAKRSIENNKDMIPHLHDHEHTVTATVGDVVKIYAKNLQLRTLGVDKDGTTEAVIFETDIQKSYNQMVFELYAKKKVKQHSIGLQYVSLKLAINDSGDYFKEEFATWNKYIEQVINKEDAEKAGYFWVVPEYALLENSAVLFGANKLTPMLDAKEDDSAQDTLTTDPSLEATQKSDAFDFNKWLTETQFIK